MIDKDFIITSREFNELVSHVDDVTKGLINNTGEVLKNEIVKTIGPTGDFKNFGEAQKFYDELAIDSSTLVLNVAAGVIDEGVLDRECLFLGMGKQVTIAGAGVDDTEIKYSNGKGIRIRLGASRMMDFTITDETDPNTGEHFIPITSSGALVKANNIRVNGGYRGMSYMYDSNFLGWNIELNGQYGDDKSAFEVGYGSTAVMHYGPTINGDVTFNADGIYAYYNSNITILHCNMELKDLNLGLQAEYNSNIYIHNANNLKMTDCDYGVFSRASGVISLDKNPVFTNVNTEYYNGKNYMDNTGSVNNILEDKAFGLELNRNETFTESVTEVKTLIVIPDVKLTYLKVFVNGGRKYPDTYTIAINGDNTEITFTSDLQVDDKVMIDY